MQSIQIFKSLFLATIMFICLQKECLSQYAPTLEQAQQYFNRGVNLVNQGNNQRSKGNDQGSRQSYQSAIDNFLISIADFPEAITYYAVVNAYAKNGAWRSAVGYIDYIATVNPPLPSEFNSSLVKMQVGVSQVRSIYARPASGLMGVPSSPDVMMPTQDWFNTTAPNLNESTIIQDFYFPRVNVQNGAQTATVTDNDNNGLGGISFFGFEGGRNLGNGTSSATSFSVGISGSSSPADFSSYNQVVFQAKELYRGVVKSYSVTNVYYKVIILGVEKNSEDSYILNTVRVQVKAYI